MYSPFGSPCKTDTDTDTLVGCYLFPLSRILSESVIFTFILHKLSSLSAPHQVTEHKSVVNNYKNMSQQTKNKSPTDKGIIRIKIQ